MSKIVTKSVNITITGQGQVRIRKVELGALKGAKLVAIHTTTKMS